MKYNTKFDLATYGAVCEDIAAKFFNDEGEFVPYIGKINAMCAFYNQCVDKESVPDNFPSEINSLSEIEPIAENDEFIRAFNSASEWDADGIDFANAYQTAMEMVEERKTSIGRVISILNNGIKMLVKELNEGLSPEMAENIGKIVKSIDGGENLAHAIAKEYGSIYVKN